MRKRLAFSLILFLLAYAECQEPDDAATRKYEDELFKAETIETTDINTTLSSTEIENNSTSSRRDDAVDATNDLDEKNELSKTRDINDEEQSDQLATDEPQSGEWTTLPPEDDYSFSMKDVFEKSINVVKDEMKGIGIIQSWLKEQSNDLGLGTTEDFSLTTDDYTDQEDIYDDDKTGVDDDLEEIDGDQKENETDSTPIEEFDNKEETLTETTTIPEDTATESTTMSGESEILHKIEEDLEKLNHVNAEEVKEVKERDDLITDIENNLNELEIISSYEDHDTTINFTATTSESVAENEDLTTEATETDATLSNDDNTLTEKDTTTEQWIELSTIESTIEEETEMTTGSKITTEFVQETTTDGSVKTTMLYEETTLETKEPITDKTITEFQEDFFTVSTEMSTESSSESIEIEDDEEDEEEDATELITIINEIELEESTTIISEMSTPEDITEETTSVGDENDYVELTTATTQNSNINTSTFKSENDEEITKIIISTSTTELQTTEVTSTSELFVAETTTFLSTTSEEISETTVNEMNSEDLLVTPTSKHDSNEDISTPIPVTKIEDETNTTNIPVTTIEDQTSTTSTLIDNLLTTVKIQNPNDIVDELVDEIIDKIEEMEETSTTTTTTEDPNKILLEETLNLTKTVDDLLNENDNIIKALTSNTVHENQNENNNSKDSDIISEVSFAEEEDEDLNDLDLDDLDNDETVMASNEYLLTSEDIENERKQILADLDSSEQDNTLDDNDHFTKPKEEVVVGVAEPRVSAVIIDRMDGNVCLNASGLSMKITTNNLTYWVPSTARVLGDCTSFGAFLNFTWRQDNKEYLNNNTLSFKFIGDDEESYIEKVVFQTNTGTLIASQLERYFTEPTIINLPKNTTLTISHANIKLSHKQREYATISLFSIDNALALQIATGCLCLFVVIIAVAIYSYRKLRSQERIFKVSLDK